MEGRGVEGGGVFLARDNSCEVSSAIIFKYKMRQLL